MARGQHLTDLERERVEKYEQPILIAQEEKTKLEEKIKRGHKAIVSDIPKDANADLEGLDRNNIAFKRKTRHRLCACCNELASKIVCYDYDGAGVIERYCDEHIKTFGPLNLK